MKDRERDLSDYTEKLSEYIDKLNEEKKPEQHGGKIDSPEQERLYETVRQVRRLREPAMPADDFPQKLTKTAAARLNRRKVYNTLRNKWYWNAVAAAVVIVAIALFAFSGLFSKDNAVLAMEEAMSEVKAYHGILEFVSTNAEGEKTVQNKMEVWADEKGRYRVDILEGYQAGLITVNNDERKWHIRPEEKKVHLFAPFPDPYRFVFELWDEVEEAKNAKKTEILGEETVLGRKTTALEVHPRGGVPYKLWIDRETHLPLKKESGMLNALQYTVAYTEIEFLEEIPADKMAFSVPEGFETEDRNPEQVVTSVVEAVKIAGFEPTVPKNLPASFRGKSISVEMLTGTIKLTYSSDDGQKRVVLLERKAEGDFKPATTAAIGKIGYYNAEFQSPVEVSEGILKTFGGMYGFRSIRWQKDGYEYAVVGNVSFDTLAGFVESLGAGTVRMPENMSFREKPQVEVPVDMESVENEQKSVDAGHSPWKLDPVFVAQVFVSLKMSPEGIQGDYPVAYENLEVVHNNGIDAVIEVKQENVPVKRVYMRRLVRQDNTGIWTVIGYDPA